MGQDSQFLTVMPEIPEDAVSEPGFAFGPGAYHTLAGNAQGKFVWSYFDKPLRAGLKSAKQGGAKVAVLSLESLMKRDETAAPTATWRCIHPGGGVRRRRGPGTDTAEVGPTVQNGETVEVLEERQNAEGQNWLRMSVPFDASVPFDSLRSSDEVWTLQRHADGRNFYERVDGGAVAAPAAAKFQPERTPLDRLKAFYAHHADEHKDPAVKEKCTKRLADEAKMNANIEKYKTDIEEMFAILVKTYGLEPLDDGDELVVISPAADGACAPVTIEVPLEDLVAFGLPPVAAKGTFDFSPVTSKFAASVAAAGGGRARGRKGKSASTRRR